MYPKGTNYIQVSACSKVRDSDQWKILEEDSELESKYAVFEPSVEVDPTFMNLALNYTVNAFMDKYVGTNINISMADFAYYQVFYADNMEYQRQVVELFNVVNMEIKLEEELISNAKKVKEYCLRKMFV